MSSAQRGFRSKAASALSAVIVSVKTARAAALAIFGSNSSAPRRSDPSKAAAPDTADNPEAKKSLNRPSLKEIVGVIVAVTLTVGFPVYASKGLEAVVLSPLAGVAGWWMGISILGLNNRFLLAVEALKWSLIAGLTVGLPFYAVEIRGQFFRANLTVAGILGFVAGLSISLSDRIKVPRSRMIKAALVFSLGMGALRLIDVALTYSLFSSLSAGRIIQIVFYVLLTTIIVTFVGSFLLLYVGRYVGRILKPVLLFYERVWAYIKEISLAVSGFVLAYVSVVVLFAGHFWAAWVMNACKYYDCGPAGTPPKELSFGDFLYFSLTTITTAGSGEVPPPGHPFTRILSGLEILMGVVLTTILVSALFTALQRAKTDPAGPDKNAV